MNQNNEFCVLYNTCVIVADIFEAQICIVQNVYYGKFSKRQEVRDSEQIPGLIYS